MSPDPNSVPRAYNRALKLVRIIHGAQGGTGTNALIQSIKDLPDYRDSFDECEKFGIFVNSNTLETELFKGDYAQPMIDSLREHNFSEARLALLDTWEANHSTVDVEILLKMIEQMGKGRFAQRLASRSEGKLVPDYIADAIAHVIDLV